MSYDDHDRCRRCGAPDDGHSRDECDRRNALRKLRSDPPPPDPMAAPHVDVCVPMVGGSMRLSSASGGLESLWVHLRNENGHEVAFDHATQQHRPAAVRLTPSQARTLADALTRYADSHKDSR